MKNGENIILTAGLSSGFIGISISVLIIAYCFGVTIIPKTIMFNKGLIIGFLLGILVISSATAYVFYIAGSTIEKTTTATQLERFKKMELTLHDLGKIKIDLNDYSDKTILINFWGTWCAPCIAEMPFLQEVYEDINDD